MFKLGRRMWFMLSVLCALWMPLQAQAQPNLVYHIAFSTTRDGSEDVFIIRADGRAMYNLTQSPARDYHPTWSPDGQRIVFVSDRTGSADLFVINLDGSGLENLTQTPNAAEIAPHWSPDGRRIVFSSNRDGGWDLYTLDLSSRDVTRVTNDALEKSAAAWFPDNQRVAYWSRQGGGSTAIFIVDTTSGQRSQLTEADDSSWPSISANGQHLIYESRQGTGDKQLVLMDLNDLSSTPEQLTTVAENVQPDWSPDGSALVFVSTRTGVADLYVMQRDGGGLRQLTAGDAPDLAPAWQPTPTDSPIAGTGASGGSFSLSQSFERVRGIVPPEAVEKIGRSEVRLNPAPPYSLKPDDLLRIRVELRVQPDGSAEATVTPDSGPPETYTLPAADLTAYTYMSAQITGIDRSDFEFDPPLDERYMLRLRPDQVNFWEWTLRPKADAVGKTNYLGVKFFLPERNEDGVMISEEGDGFLRFTVDVSADAVFASALPTSTAIPVQGLRLLPDGARILTILALTDTGEAVVGLRSTQGEGWLDLDFGVSGSLPAGTCLIYLQDGSSVPTPAVCDPTHTKILIIPYGDVFWYDYVTDEVVDLRITLKDQANVLSQRQCPLATAATCDF